MRLRVGTRVEVVPAAVIPQNNEGDADERQHHDHPLNAVGHGDGGQTSSPLESKDVMIAKITMTDQAEVMGMPNMLLNVLFSEVTCAATYMMLPTTWMEQIVYRRSCDLKRSVMKSTDVL